MSSKGSVIGTIGIILLIVYVLFGISDPVEAYDGFLSLIQKIADAGDWVRNLWYSFVHGSFKDGWKLFVSDFKEMFDFGLLDFLK